MVRRRISQLRAVIVLGVFGASVWYYFFNVPSPEVHSQRTVAAAPHSPKPKPGKDGKVSLTDTEWKLLLDSQQHRVLRAKGTEPAFSGNLWDHHEDGTYSCAGCGLELFRSDTKFDSGTGWPSFHSPAAKTAIVRQDDDSLGGHRVEVTCARCGGHLGHVFDDGPAPTGKRYCINSVSLDFTKKTRP